MARGLHNLGTLPKKQKICAVTMREFFAYQLQQWEDKGTNILEGGKLLQELIVDPYAGVEEQRLRWARNNQGQLRTGLYQGLCDAFQSGGTNTSSVGKKVILPSSFTGGPRYMLQNYQDAMAICSWAGVPDLFITFTCNPNWVEFTAFFNMIPGQTASDRPDIISYQIQSEA